MKTLIFGLPIGLLFGYALQRGGFCMNTAFRESLFTRDTRLLKAYGIAIFMQMALLAFLGGVLNINPVTPPVWWVAAPIGGFVFGVGMVLARGCTSGNFYRLGEGLIGAYVVVITFIIGIAIADKGILEGWRVWSQGYTLPVPGQLDAWLGVHPGWFALVLGLVLVGTWRNTPHGSPFSGRWDWREAGLVIGLIASAAWVASAITGRHYGLSIIQPTQAMGKVLFNGDFSAINWSFYVLLALPLGAAFGARKSGQFEWRLPYPTRILQQMLGGLLMGVGGVVAGGCNIGHGLTGVAALSITSLLATGFVVLGCWAGVYLVFNRLKIAR